ncbi:MAG: choice-of-anchor J domain-containing protein [Muribaculaceae bacterium]|nr:choice-of-anchor J domain-containing protein [Muribaculaceae bacterium]
MKLFNKYLSLAAVAMAAGASLTSCQNDFDLPPIDEPKATMVANTTIAQLKEQYWQDDLNYYTTVGKTAADEDVIVHGRVVSSDATGNIYKSLVIQDETGALTFSINQTGMNNTYRVGQEVVVNLTELGFGKYAGLQQVGGYGEYNGTPQVSFMDYNLFQTHAELNGFPEPEYKYINPGEPRPTDGSMYCLVADMGNLPTTPAGQREWQSQLVVFRNVHFEGGGELPFAESDATTNRNLLDANGNSILVRNSSYSSFRSEIMPAGTGDVMGILSYFNGKWQLLLRSSADCIFDAKGQASDPYTVAEAIELQGTGKSGWTEGYIVGSVKAGVTDIDSNDKIIWSADAEIDNTLVIAPAADVKDINKCLVLTLPQGSSLRKHGNLVDNPRNYGKKISVTGSFDSYLGTYGLLNTSGAVTEYKIEGVDPGTDPGETVSTIDETFASGSIPSSWKNIKVKGDKEWYVTTFNDNAYAAMTGFKGNQPPFESWLITPAINAAEMPEKVLSFDTQVNGYSSTESSFEVYVMDSNDPAKAKLTKLNPTLATAPASGYSQWVNSGKIDLSQFSGVIYIGFVYKSPQAANYATWCVDNVLVGKSQSSGGTTEPEDPDTGGKGSVSDPYTVAEVMATTADATGVWVDCYVVGYIDGKKWPDNAKFTDDTSSVEEYNNTNIILGSTASASSTSNSIPGGIKAGAIRDQLGIAKNPSIYKKHILVKGDITRYFGTRGVKNISEYKEL